MNLSQCQWINLITINVNTPSSYYYNNQNLYNTFKQTKRMLSQILLFTFTSALLTVLTLPLAFYLYMRTSRLSSLQKPSPYYQLTLLLGSGGHTGELSLMIKDLHFDRLDKLNVLITATDKSSRMYFENLFVKQLATSGSLKGKVEFYEVSRTNEVKQSYLTSIFTTLRTTLTSLHLLRTSLLSTTHFLSNGPGTCVPFFFLFWVMNKMRLTRTKLIFVESWCRVDSLSLSGRIVRYWVDRFIVHWEEQKAKYPWVQYYGRVL